MSGETYNVRAVVLKREPFRERDSRVIFYSEDHGKLELVARGTKKILSKLAGHLEPFNHVNVMVVPGRQFAYVGTASAAQTFTALKSDYLKLMSVGGFIAKFNQAIKPGVADKRLYHRLVSYLELFDALPQNLSQLGSLITALYLLKLLADLGYRPELDRCANCATIEKLNKFSAARGGLICEDCARKGASKLITLSPASLALLRAIIRSEIDLELLENIPVAQSKEIEAVSGSFYNHYLAA